MNFFYGIPPKVVATIQNTDVLEVVKVSTEGGKINMDVNYYLAKGSYLQSHREFPSPEHAIKYFTRMEYGE